MTYKGKYKPYKIKWEDGREEWVIPIKIMPGKSYRRVWRWMIPEPWDDIVEKVLFVGSLIVIILFWLGVALVLGWINAQCGGCLP